jgi:hypothetical protein
MRRTMLTVCEICGNKEPAGAADFLVFHCLTFCSPDCRDDYRTADDDRRTKNEARRSTRNTKARRSRAA